MHISKKKCIFAGKYIFIMKAGKALEQLVAAIQEYLGDNPDTHIERNAKLTDNAGLQREIDVFVQTKVQGGKIGIAFECKDYKSIVQVSVVEAFQSKCNDIPQIHKKIIVASNGFSSGAQSKANLYGIELYQLGNVPFNDIFLPNCDIYRNQCWVSLSTTYWVITEDGAPDLNPDKGVFYHANDHEVEMFGYLYKILHEHLPHMLPNIHNHLCSQHTNMSEVPLTITPPDKLYVIDINEDKHFVKELLIAVLVRIKTQLQDIAKQSVYTGVTEDAPIVRISEYKHDDRTSLLLMHGKDNWYSAFIKDEKGQLRKTILPSQPTKIK